MRHRSCQPPWLRYCSLVFCARFEIQSIVTLVKLGRRLAEDAIYHTAPLDGRPLEDFVCPSLNVLIVIHGQEFGCIV